MSDVPPELVTLLRHKSPDMVLIADLYEITLKSAAVLRYCTADQPIVYDGQSYGTQIQFDRPQISWKAGLEVDTMTVKTYADGNDLIEGIPFHEYLRRGGLDGAYLVLRRAYYADPNLPPVAVLWRFSGLLDAPQTDGLTAQLTVKSYLTVLDTKLPRNLYQAPCGHGHLYDAGCAVNRDDYAVSGVVQAGSTNLVIQTLLANPAGWFDLGVMQFTSGALAGTTRTIKSYGNDGSLTVIPPLLSAPASGDEFTAWPGCDRTLATCEAKFSNKLRYRGQPWIPVPEMAV